MHRIVSIGVLTCCMLAFARTSLCLAQSKTTVPQDTLSPPDHELDEVTITASRAELKLSQTAQIVTVISQKKIEQQPAQSIQDILKIVAGVDVRQRGGNGVQSDVSLRGGSSDQVAILLNGINISSPQTGHYSFDIPVNLSDIERIEIVQGPAALQYGAGAFSGGINIITKKRPDTKIFLSAEAGMYQLRDIEGRTGLQTKHTSHQISAAWQTSSGYIPNSDYKILNSLWQSHLSKGDSKLDFQLGYNNKAYGANTFYSAAYPNQFDETQSILASLQGETGIGKWKINPKAYWNRHLDCFQLFRDGTPNLPSWYTQHNYHQSDVSGFNLNTRYTWNWGVTSIGGEFRNESILSNVLGKPLPQPKGNYTKSDSRNNISAFLEQYFLLNRWTVSLGVLANYNTSLHTHTDFFPNLNASYQLNEHIKLFSSWNSALRMPTFTDLYYTTKTHISNSNLLPEKSRSLEAGVKFAGKSVSAYFTSFYTQGKNIIDWTKKNPDDLWESKNLTQLDKVGIETGLQLQPLGNSPFLKQSSLSLGYLYIQQSKNTNDLISNYALDYLKHKLTAQWNHPIIKNLTAHWQFRWQDRAGTYTRYENLKPATEVPYPPYALLDLKINWQWKRIKVFANANNLFNTLYYDLGNVPQPGFWFSGGMSYSL